MTPNPYDQACRYLFRPFAVPLLGWLLRLAPGGVDFVDWLDTRGLPWPGQPDRTCDTVAHLRDTGAGGVPWAVPVEFQSDPDPAMFGRGMVYLGNLWLDYRPTDLRGDRFEVGMVVVYLRGEARCSRKMRMSGTKLLTTLGVAECNLSLLPAAGSPRQIEAGKAPAALLPWIPLFQGGDEPSIIAEWVRAAEAQTDAALRQMVPRTKVFADAAGCVAPWAEAMKGWDEMESQVVNEWTARARRDERATISLRILRRIQADLPKDLEQSVRRIDDLDRLDAVVDSALSSATIEDFRRATGL